MGKKGRKTRWRTLAITGGESDSEDSTTLTGSQISKAYHKPYFSKFSYSSQSTPTKRYHNEAKSTRSSSTASENKITFNEDEYTRITTPRQDVLFKKGYLNKPKNYQTQTSTGNSTTSTGNSTGNGTPDHQSADGTEGTDLEYESQFVFPNGFVDQNGIYYINSFEPYPLVMYNPPICYPEYPSSRSKRYSTDSMTESTSPQNEEASHDQSQSGGETAGNTPEFSQPMYNVIYPSGYYFNGVCGANALANGQGSTEPRKIKKKRRRKISKSVTLDGTTSSDDCDSSDEDVTQVENRVYCSDTQKTENLPLPLNVEDVSHTQSQSAIPAIICTDENDSQATRTPTDSLLVSESTETNDLRTDNADVDKTTEESISSPKDDDDETPSLHCDVQAETEIDSSNLQKQDTLEKASDDDITPTQNMTCPSDDAAAIKCSKPVDETNLENSVQQVSNQETNSKFNLNAEEFIPRAYRSVPVDRNLQFVNIHPNFIPIPLLSPMNELAGPNFNHTPAFLPPGIPLNFLPPDPKLLQNFINFVPNHNYVVPKQAAETVACDAKTEEVKEEEVRKDKFDGNAKDQCPVKIDVSKVHYKNDIDIAKIVSKLEEAAKEQRLHENKRHNHRFSNKFNNKVQRPRYGGLRDKSDTYDNYRTKTSGRNYRKPEPLNSNKPGDSPEKVQVDVAQQKPVDLNNEEETHVQNVPPKDDKVMNGITKYVSSRDHTPTGNQNFNGSPKRYNRYQNGPTKTPNYSETVKKTYAIQNKAACPRYERHADRQQPSPTTKKPHEPMEKERNKSNNVATQKPANQWISVSNRKKRRNKSADEAEAQEVWGEDEVENETNIDAFEDFDVNLLQDVVIVKTGEENIVQQENSVDNFMEMIKNHEPSPIKVDHDDDDESKEIILQDVKDIEDKLLQCSAKLEQPEVKHDQEAAELKSKMLSGKRENQSAKKKSKKGTQKPLTKRIIIVDAAMESATKPLSEEDKCEASIETKKEPQEDLTEEVTEVEFNTKMVSENVSTPDKKKAKKKKKPAAKTTLTKASSTSSSLTTLNNTDDSSYDFLLDTSVLEEKTNLEISEELDKMIQKGMYSNLEEKIKSLHVSSPISDDFFKSISFKRATPEKNLINPNNFGALIKNTGQILGRHVEDNKKIDIDFSKIRLPNVDPQPSTSKTGTFLEKNIDESVPQEINLNTKSNGKLKNKSKKNLVKTGTEVDELKNYQEMSETIIKNDDEFQEPNEQMTIVNGIDAEFELEKKEECCTKIVVPSTLDLSDKKWYQSDVMSDDKTKVVEEISLKTLYPITQAVKEWMTKTRENTPEVELLKSPDTIYREFIEEEDEAESEQESSTNSKNDLGNPINFHNGGSERVAKLSNASEEEIVIFENWSVSQDNVTEGNLSDCWEDDVMSESRLTNGYEKKPSVEEGEDVLEVYESKYGKNEDYLKLRAEVEEKQPKHGNLPYRAICCNLM